MSTLQAFKAGKAINTDQIVSETEAMFEKKVDEREALLAKRGYPEVMRSGQAAKCLGVSKNTLKAAFEDNKIEGTDTGTETRFDRRDIAKAWVEGQRESNW